MEINKLIETFAALVVLDPKMFINERHRDSDGTTVSVMGDNGIVDVEFADNGEIFATVENDEIFHGWMIDPEDISSGRVECAGKIRNFVSSV